MPLPDPEIEQLRDQVNCAVLLERAYPPWHLDRRASTPNALKYRRGKGEILIVSHKGRGWWDPQSEKKGDIFNLVQFLEPGLNFGSVRKFLRPLAGLSPSFPPAQKLSDKRPERSIAQRWAKRPPIRQGSATWDYLTMVRRLPPHMLEGARVEDVLREGPNYSAWFAHRDHTNLVTHVEIRGPAFKGSLRGGAKCLFRFHSHKIVPKRFVLTEAPIDALSLASIESATASNLFGNTLYAATGGGMGAATIEAIQDILSTIKDNPDAIFCSGTDANPAGDRYAERQQDIATNIGVRFERLRPPIEKGDWNDILKQNTQR
ncbi:MAG TPA: DUF3991 and TOPRIM domain-containing protein [Methylocella sp.]|nr:DUF3991 and TOPRIM domain-containing protein [Methylocella sp.]